MWWAGERLPIIAMSGSCMKFQAIRCHSKLRVALITAIHLRTDKLKRVLTSKTVRRLDVRFTPNKLCPHGPHRVSCGLGLSICHVRLAFTVGHSVAIMLYTQVSRSVPLSAI